MEKSKVVDSYKNLQEVEILFDDFKNFVDVRPIRHWLEEEEAFLYLSSYCFFLN